MFERYTEKARRAIFFARYEASQFGSSCIETEHLLLGLFRDVELSRRFLGPVPAADPSSEVVSREIMEAEKRIGYIVHRLDNAVASQEFEKARFYSEEERKERGNLREFRRCPSPAVPPDVKEAEQRIEAVMQRLETAIARKDFQEANLCSQEEIRERGNLRQLREKHNLRAAGDRGEGGILAGIRSQIEARTPRREKVSTSTDLPLSHESKRVLSLSAEEAERLNHQHSGPEHLLLGLLREEQCFAAELLRERGLSLSKMREEVARTSLADTVRPGFGFGAGRGGMMGSRSPIARFAGQWMAALEDAGRVAQMARHAAAQRHSPCIETTDLLLALTHEKEVAERLLNPVVDSIRNHKDLQPASSRERVAEAELSFSEDAKLVFNFAVEEAAQLGHRTGPRHVLLGIFRAESCAAADILRDCGLTAAGIRAQLVPPPPPSDPEQGRNYV